MHLLGPGMLLFCMLRKNMSRVVYTTIDGPQRWYLHLYTIPINTLLYPQISLCQEILWIYLLQFLHTSVFLPVGLRRFYVLPLLLRGCGLGRACSTWR